LRLSAAASSVTWAIVALDSPCFAPVGIGIRPFRIASDG
jgi:hypothetical protein